MSQVQNTQKVCQEDECQEPAKARGFCARHYARWYRLAFPERRTATEEKRRDKAREYRRQHYLANREAYKERLRKQREADPEGYKRRKRENAARWRKENPERERENVRRGFARRKYGLTLEEYEATIARGCAICGTHEGKLCIDHDHTNGKVRDALCNGCNTGLGSLGDDPARLRAAANYIEQHQ